MPAGMRVVRIAEGAATLRYGEDFEAKLILIPAPKDADLGLKVEGDLCLQLLPCSQEMMHFIHCLMS